MKSVFKILSAASLVLGLAFAAVPASAQNPPAPSAAAIAAATEILTLKHVGQMYAYAVPNIVEQTKNRLTQNNLNYQKDLNEVAPIVAKNLAGREKEIGEGMAKAYAAQFTEQELKQLVTFYKSPLGQKLITAEPKAIEQSMAYMNQWGQQFSQIVADQFRTEMKKRGKPIM